MFRYAVWGVLLRSDLPLPSLRPARDGDSERLALTLLHSEAPLGDPERWLYTERLGDTTQPWRAVGASRTSFFVRLFGAVDFVLERESPTARFFVAKTAPLGVVEPLFLEQALPLWLSLLGRPCLHASAVAWGRGDDARAIAFAGRSGSGKSTLATSLAAASSMREGAPGGSMREGAPGGERSESPGRERGGDRADGPGGLIADDCLPVEIDGDRLLAYPGHRAVRLLEDSAHALFADPHVGELSLDGSKRRVDVPAADVALPLARFYVLEPAAGEARATRLRPRDALARLATHLFRIDPEDYGRLPAELALLERVAARVRVVRLEVPRRFDALGEVRAVIAEDLAGD